MHATHSAMREALYRRNGRKSIIEVARYCADLAIQRSTPVDLAKQLAGRPAASIALIVSRTTKCGVTLL